MRTWTATWAGWINISARTRQIILANNGIRTSHYAMDPASGRHHPYQCRNWRPRRSACLKNGGRDHHPAGRRHVSAAALPRPTRLCPAMRSMVHGELWLGPCEIIIAAGICLSGITALKYGAMAVASARPASAVATGSELASTFMRNGFFQGHERQNRAPGNGGIPIQPFPLRRSFCAGCFPTAPGRC